MVGYWLGQDFQQPVRQALSGPVFARTGWGRDFRGIHLMRGHEHPQPLEATGGSLGTTVIDAYVALEAGAGLLHNTFSVFEISASGRPSGA